MWLMRINTSHSSASIEFIGVHSRIRELKDEWLAKTAGKCPCRASEAQHTERVRNPEGEQPMPHQGTNAHSPCLFFSGIKNGRVLIHPLFYGNFFYKLFDEIVGYVLRFFKANATLAHV